MKIILTKFNLLIFQNGQSRVPIALDFDQVIHDIAKWYNFQRNSVDSDF